MDLPKRVPLGIIAISVIMIFIALATDIFWIAKLAGRPFPQSIKLDPKVYNAFALPDILSSILLYVGAYGLLKLRKFGLVTTLIAMGMSLWNSLLLLGITKLSHINIIGPSLFFVVFTVIYLWINKALFE